MSTAEVVLVALSSIAAGSSGMFAWLSKRSQAEHRSQAASDAARQEQQVQFYATVIAECKSLRDSNQELQKQINSLQGEVHKLREQLEFYEENHLASEAREMLEKIFNEFHQEPAWIHDLGNSKWYLNDAYCKTFSVNRKSFWSPVNIFGRYDSEDAVRYSANDMTVVDAGATIEFSERARKRIMDPRCDEFIEGRFQKTPFFVGSRPYVVGRMLERTTS